MPGRWRLLVVLLMGLLWPMSAHAQTVLGYFQEFNSPAPVPWRDTDTRPDCASGTLIFWTEYGPPLGGEICGVTPNITLEDVRTHGRAMTGDINLESASILGGIARWKDTALGPMQACVDAAGAELSCDKVIGLGTGEIFEVLGPSPTYSSLFRITSSGVITGLATSGTQQVFARLNNTAGNHACDGATDYFWTDSNTGNQDTVNMRVRAGTFSNMRVRASALVPTSHTLTITFRVNNASTALSCSIAAGQQECTDTDSVTVATNDLVHLMEVCSGGTTTLSSVNVSLELVTP